MIIIGIIFLVGLLMVVNVFVVVMERLILLFSKVVCSFGIVVVVWLLCCFSVFVVEIFFVWFCLFNFLMSCLIWMLLFCVENGGDVGNCEVVDEVEVVLSCRICWLVL